MTNEEKATTVVLNSDGKSIGDLSSFNRVITFDNAIGTTMPNIIALSSMGGVKSFEEFINTLRKIKAGKKTQRVIIDTFTSLITWFLKIAQKTAGANKFDVWNNYNSMIDQLFTELKDFSNNEKAVYVFAHNRENFSGKSYIAVKGTEHKDLIESHFSTIVEAGASNLDRPRFFYKAESNNDSNTTRTGVPNAKLSFARHSLIDLEDYLFADTFKERKKVVEEAERKTAEDLDNTEEDELFTEF
jgi:hypothetical protein